MMRGTETVTVFPEIITTTKDGNTVPKASDHGQIVRGCVVQPIASTLDEERNGAYLGTGRYRLRLPREYERANSPLGSKAAVEWRGDRYSVVGDPVVYSGSRRTQHTDYVIERR